MLQTCKYNSGQRDTRDQEHKCTGLIVISGTIDVAIGSYEEKL